MFLVLAEVIIALSPIIKLFALAVQLAMFILKPFLDLIGEIAEILIAIVEWDADKFGDGIKRAFGGLLRILFPSFTLWRAYLDSLTNRCQRQRKKTA